MKYKETKETKDDDDLDKKPLTTKNFLTDNKENIFLIVGYNLLMLLFGYLGETNVISNYISIPIGFIFFIKSFEVIYKNYANKTLQGEKLFLFLTIIWGLYGVAATFTANLKNVSYNVLDIVSKNFYGLYIYYEILKLSGVN
jgi:amino acid permease